MDFQSFQHSHASQLANVPQVYWRALYEKLQYEVYDAGKYFCMNHDEDGWSVLVSNKEGVKADDPSCIFLVDHAWTFQADCAKKQLGMINGLAARMASLMGLTEGEEEEEGRSYDADSESGDEKEQWSDSDTESPTNQDPTTSDISHTLPPTQSCDGYDSGDLGDVSCAYSTEVPESGGAGQGRKVRRKKAHDNKRPSPAPEDFSSTDKGCGLGVTSEAVDVVSGETLQVTVSLPTFELLRDILRDMWRYCHAYHINNSMVPMWYIMDEFGSRIRHSTTPTMSLLSFFYIPTQLAYTLLWPVKELKAGDHITCNFLPSGVKPGLEEACHSLLWSHDCHMTLDDPLWKELDQFVVPELKERCSEAIPDSALPAPPPMLNYSVYTDMKMVETHLTHPSFHFLHSKKDADILWLSEHFKNFRSLPPGQLVNQFPCENVITCKDLLVTVARRGRDGDTPEWLPLTFNLLYELPKFVRTYLERKEGGEENTWILKPWNLGRGMDIHITDNLLQIICLAQAGPKIASKYITDPVLFHRPEVGLVKFDYRYVVLLRSVQPLELYIYNVFWLRFANRPFCMEDLTDYETHFTVMNYKPQVVLKQIHCEDFVPLFEQQYPEYKWSDIQEKTCKLFKELFTSASTGSPPGSIAPCGQSRAIYAADLMLEKVPSPDSGLPTFEPRLLEVNYCPDCERACKYHPDFFNHVFQVLFMGTTAGLPVTRIA